MTNLYSDVERLKFKVDYLIYKTNDVKIVFGQPEVFVSKSDFLTTERIQQKGELKSGYGASLKNFFTVEPCIYFTVLNCARLKVF